ncbi:DUF4281 domain-containing protein [Rhizobium sp. CG5]|uniref:ABA4-like family protein n=1 Tax=Rhizobium sp. CG5 TaxID=2726076 RepID=UPI002033E9CF|nr:ABA4-like family protein [Rhizobium sp. CG5]MCM2473921.1 DUF4281 domain-containing protein [Rhizobium sp. CG5]
MHFELLFSVASTAAMAGWLALILLPRWQAVIGLIRFGLIGALSLTYAVLIFVYFFRVAGGGFGSIAEVRALFMSDGVLVAGWIHYLAFDLFVGTWIAVEADRRGYHRLLQALILAATFLFGPIGLLVFYLTRATDMALTFRKA